MDPTRPRESSFINNLLPPRPSSDIRVGRGLESETSKVGQIEWVKDDEVRTKHVDTPGFDGSRRTTTFPKKEYNIGSLFCASRHVCLSYKAKTSKSPDFLNRSSGGNGDHLLNATVDPGFCNQDHLEAVSIHHSEWGRFQSSSMNTLPFSESQCITNCIQLLHLANCVPDVSSMIPTGDDIMFQTIAWIRNFACHVKKSLGNAQHGYVTLKNILRFGNPHELQIFTNDFVNAVTATQDDWRSSQSSMEKMYHEYRSSLRARPRRLSRWLNGRKVRERLNVLLMIVGTMKLLLGDITAAIGWWTSLRNTLKIWEDAACLLTSGHSFNGGLENELIHPINVLDSYCVAYQGLSGRLSRLVDSMSQDRLGDL